MVIVNEKPVLSVRLMTHNHADFIRSAMDGIMMQKTSFQFEVVVGDDFSTDGTLDIIKEYASTDKIKIRILERNLDDDYVRKRQQLGRLHNFVDIIENCTGRYIALLDGDDYWIDERKLQKQVDYLEDNPDCVITYHDACIVDESDNRIAVSKLPDVHKRDASKHEMINQEIWILTCTACYRNVIDWYPSEFYKVVNGDSFLFSILGQYGKAKYLGNEIESSVYRQHRGGVWSAISNVEKMLHILNTYEQLRLYWARELGTNDSSVKAYLGKRDQKKSLLVEHIRNSNYKVSYLFSATRRIVRGGGRRSMLNFQMLALIVIACAKREYSRFRVRLGAVRRTLRIPGKL